MLNFISTPHHLQRTLTQAFGGVRYERACGGAGGTRGRGKKQPKVVVEMDEPEKGNGLGLGGGGAEQVLDMHTQGVKKLVRAARQRDTQMIVMSLGMSRRTQVSLRFRGLFLYTVIVLCNVEWCIRQLLCSSIISYKITRIAYNHHTDIVPIYLKLYKHIYLQNTSKFLPKSDELFWRVQLVFVAAAPNSRTPGSQHAFPASALLHSSLECLHDGGLSIGKSSAVAVASAPANVKGNNAPGSEGSSSSSSSSNGGVTAATAAATAATAVALMAPQSPLVGMCISACHENTSLRDILNRFLDPPNNNNNNNNNNGSNNGPKQEDNAVQRHALRYLRQNREKVVCLLQSVPSPASDPVFVEVGGLLLGLDGEGEGGGAAAGESASSIQKDDGTLDRSLRAALQGQAVIEYPTLVFGVQTDLAHVRRPVAIIRGDSPVELTLSGAVGVSDGMITEEGSTSLTPRVAGISVEEVGEEQEEEEEEDDEEADAEFMKEVVELYSADIADLKKIIASEEA